MLCKPEGIRRRAVQLVVPKPLAALGDCRNVTRRNPPEAVIRFARFLEPFGAVAKDPSVVGGVGKTAQRLERLPDGHIDDDKRVVAVGDIRGVARFRLQAPEEAGSLVGERVYWFELGDELGDLRIIEGRDKPGNVDLSEMIGHGGLEGCPIHAQSYIRKSPPGFLLLRNRVPARNSDSSFCQREFGPAVGMSLVVAFRAHVRICGTQVQEPKPVVDVNLGETRIAR